MNINELSKTAGITVRTLQYYDKINLLNAKRNENNYRYYDDECIDKLQQILFYRECGFDLKSIKKLMEDKHFNKEEACLMQKKYLEHEKKRIEKMLMTLEKTINSLKGGPKMANSEKFAGFDFKSNPYEAEARELYGGEAVDKNKAYLENLSGKDKEALADSFNDIFRNFARLMDRDAASAEVQNEVSNFYNFLNMHTGIDYSPEMFAGIGELYTADERFTKNIDKFGEGLASFLSKAIAVYSKRQ